jgi:aspartate-semialdehyde dehydrogenase
VSRVGILEPGGLLGKELREQLESRPELATELRLMTQREEEVGTLTEIAGAAAMIQSFMPEDLETLDLLFLCEPREAELEVLDRLPPSLATIVVSPTVPIPRGRPVIAGDDEVERGVVLVSPHAAVVGLAHLLRPLATLGLQEAVATLLLPASIYDQDALEEVFAQTRALLEFKRPAAGRRFSHQLAFNVLPGPPDEAVIVEQLAALLIGSLAHPRLERGGPRLAVHSLQAGVFHGLALSVFCQLASDVVPEDVIAALSGREQVELAETPEAVGPVAAATGETVLVGEIRSAVGQPGAFWLWAALDNLTRGGATNAIEIAARVLVRS